VVPPRTPFHQIDMVLDLHHHRGLVPPGHLVNNMVMVPIRIRLVRLWEWGVTVLPSSLLELPFQRQFLEGSINFRLQRPEIILPLVSRVIPTKIRTILSSRSDGYIYIELIIRMPQGGAVSGWHHQGETRRVGIIKGKYINEPSSQR